MKIIFLLLVSFLFFCGQSFSQQLIINEISQGTSSKEYVEFVVMGTSTCQTPVPCIDLRGVVLDDNDGYFSTSASGSGIAGGAIRFANISFWSCIPQGTIIVIYNTDDVNPAIPANDVSMSDGNCRLIIPVNSNLLEGQSASPSSSLPYVYPTSGWVAGGGLWAQIAMSNSNDSFQIRATISSPTPTFAVNWGNNTLNSQIYFTSASNAVFSMTNTVSNNPTIQSNWTNGAVGTNETPGVGNNAANAAWISSMNPQCSVGAPTLQVSLVPTNETCASLCDGAINSTISNGFGPYTYVWSNGATSSNLTDLCPGNYSVTVQDQNGCTDIANVTILAGISSGNPSIQSAGPFSVNDAPFQLIPMTSGGNWFADCGSCLSATGVFSPSVSGAGTFQICHIIGSGLCADTACINIVVSNCPPQFTNETLSICPGTSVTVFGQSINSAGSFSQLFSDMNGCDSTHTITVQVFSVFPTNTSITICDGDSVLIIGNWVSSSLYVEEVVTDFNGCLVKNSATVEVEPCYLEEFELFVPNVFTPNNDGTNDIFGIELTGGFLDEGYILNRWGEKIAKFDNENRTWKGKTLQGMDVVDGVYTYVLYYTPIGKNQDSIQGFVTVIR